MKRKAIAIILGIISVIVCLLTFSACSKNEDSEENYVFSKLQWGMTPKQVKKAMKIPKDIVAIPVKGRDTLVMYKPSTITTNDGLDIEVGYSTYYFNEESGLEEILYTSMDISYETMMALEEYMTELYGECTSETFFKVPLDYAFDEYANGCSKIWKNSEAIVTLNYCYSPAVGDTEAIVYRLSKEPYSILPCILIEKQEDK